MSSRGKEHAADVVMTKVDIADMLVPALKSKPEAAVEDCLDERDIALNCSKLNHHHGPSVQKTVVNRCKRSTQALGGLLRIPYHWRI